MPRSEIQNERRKQRRRATRAPKREAAERLRRRPSQAQAMPEVVVLPRRTKREIPA